MIDLLDANRTEIAAICERFGVSRLEVFGSAARGDFEPASSDLDFLIEFEDYGPGIADRYFDFIRAMEAHFGRKVDTVFGPNVKNPILQEEIDQTRELVYESPGRKIAA
jgi:predicted nucleotidyltransferase